MNPNNQGESSSAPSAYIPKRGRGRPRKDPSLKHTRPAHMPPGFVPPKENTPHKPDREVTLDSMVGQVVTGVVEATFGDGYLLSVRIGDSATNLRGVVFKPGHYVPVTAENDVAPHVPMIKRHVIADENQNWSGPGKLAIQTAPRKRKYTAPKIPSSVPPVGVRGSVIPVVLQPVQFPNGFPNSTQTAHLMNFGDKDVHMVEPLSMLPPDRSIPVSQIFAGPQSHSSEQVLQDSEQKECNSFNVGTSVVEQGEKVEPIENGEKAVKSSAEEIGSTKEPSSTESPQVPSITKPLFSYGTGRMTELLQAVQENMKENLVQIAEPPNSAPNAEFHEMKATETDARNGASVP